MTWKRGGQAGAGANGGEGGLAARRAAKRRKARPTGAGGRRARGGGGGAILTCVRAVGISAELRLKQASKGAEQEARRRAACRAAEEALRSAAGSSHSDTGNSVKHVQQHSLAERLKQHEIHVEKILPQLSSLLKSS